MSGFFRTLLTGKDNVSYDLIKVGAGATILTYLGLSIINYHVFNPMQFGTGFGLIVTGVGSALALKARTEPGG